MSHFYDNGKDWRKPHLAPHYCVGYLNRTFISHYGINTIFFTSFELCELSA